MSAVPGAPCPSKRQYASVPFTSSLLAGRAGRTATGAKLAKRSSKSIGIEKLSTGPVTWAISAASAVRDSGSWARIHGLIVSTSIVLRTRSKWYSRIMPPPPKYRFW